MEKKQGKTVVYVKGNAWTYTRFWSCIKVDANDTETILRLTSDSYLLFSVDNSKNALNN